MTVFLNEESRKSRDDATKIAKTLVFTSLEDVSSAIYIDHIKNEVIAELDERLLKSRDVAIDDLNAVTIPRGTVRVEENSLFITPKENRYLKRILEKAPATRVKGIPGIRRALVSNEDDEWLINTDGSNMSAVFEVPGVDLKRTTTNNVHEIAETLGIEAARNLLIREAISVLEEQGLDVDVRHVMLVSDIMTNTGVVYQIGRHGVSGKKASVIARAAFEITVPTLVDAAIRGKKDMFKGVTESVIVGQNIPVGTGIIELFMGHGNAS
jgi:DNA-directed RNA polymerase subunit A"